MFINFTNHGSSRWSEVQLKKALEYGSIVDIPFPRVEPNCTRETIQNMADSYAAQIIDMKPDCVLCQGEFCLCVAVIERLKAKNIKVVAACSKREAEEIVTEHETKKISRFAFVQFREY